MVMSHIRKLQHGAFIISVMVIGIVSLVQPGCDCSSGSSPSPSPVASVFPPQSTDGALVSTAVTASFRDDMNSSTINTTTFTLTLGGAPVAVAAVSYDAASKTAILTPASDLVSGTEYRATISSVVESVSGSKPLTADFVWSFTISPAIVLVSKDSNSVVGNNLSLLSAIDGTGRYIVFESLATNLASTSTTNGRNHIYRKDTLSGDVVLVSSDAAGLEANNSSSSSRISDNGRFVVFESRATNLSPISTGGTNQIFIKDLANGSVELASRDLAGAVATGGISANPDVSNDGRIVVFESDAANLTPLLPNNGATQIYLKDMADESVDMISRNTIQSAGGNAASNRPNMSSDARYIVFDSFATDLVAGATGIRHIYFVDMFFPNTTKQISVDSSGINQGNGYSIDASVSDDGLFIAFESVATNLVPGGTTLSDIYRRERGVSTLLVSSPDGANGTTSGNNASVGSSISGDGTYVAFESAASNLAVEGGLGFSDIFVRDFSTPLPVRLDRVNLPQSGVGEATANSNGAAISSDGRYVSFDSIFNYDITDINTIKDVYRAYNSTF